MIALGIILLILGVTLIVGEFFTGSGLLMASGILGAIAGIVILIFGRSTAFQVDVWLIVLLSIIAAGVLAFVILRIIATYRRQATTGKEDLKGKTALVKEALNPEGTVLFQGELWNAVSDSGLISPGEEVTITGIEGLKLFVIKKDKK